MGGNLAQHCNRIETALRGSGAARSALVASWQRSAALHRLDPAERREPERLSDTELARARDRLGSLVVAAQGSLDRLYSAVGGAGCCVLLADRNGVPVERRGAAADDPVFRDWGLWTGTVWSEEREGTNGIGTCLVEERALTIHRDQHFHGRNAGLSCTTAPVFDHEGRLAGALDVSSARSDLNEAIVALIAVAVNDAARRIEADAFRLAFPAARIVLAPTPDNALNALLAVDADDCVIGATRLARTVLGISAADLDAPRPATGFLGGGEGASLEDLRQSAVNRALAQASGNVSAAARALGISRATLHRRLARERTH
ncbi:MAG: Fis family transcriptional regulator [Mesorhizobium amorphae]|nr:MAG: Fis family transcriptional regulator [Mesorhizobium amorphae]